MALLGNALGAALISGLVVLTQDFSPGFRDLLDEIIASKLSWLSDGRAGRWLQLRVIGVDGEVQETVWADARGEAASLATDLRRKFCD